MKSLSFLIIVILNISFFAHSFVTVNKINDKWFFINENGEPFISRGINQVNINGDIDKKTLKDTYNETIKLKYQSYESWAQSTSDRMTEMGFNTIGAWSNFEYFDSMYFIYILYPGSNDWSSGAIDDYFSPRFEEESRKHINQEITNHNLINNKKLIGYCIGNELRWGIDWRSMKTIVFDYLNMNENTYGKKAVISFFQKYYNSDIKKFNSEWFVNLKDWESGLSYKNFRNNSTLGKQAEKKILTQIASKYYQVTTDIIREIDNNHLILGSRFIGAVTPKEIVIASSYYVDVISINYYQLIFDLDKTLPYFLNYTKTDNCLKEFYQLSEKPLIITEFGFRGKTKDAPSTKPFIFPVYFTEKSRAKAFEKEIESFMATDYIIGYHIFKWMDQPKNGRNMTDGENNNCGIVTIYDDVYQNLYSSFKKCNF